MTNFKAKMHQIRFRRWGAYSAHPDTSWIWGPLRGRGRAGMGRGGKGEREGKWRRGKWRAPKLLLNQGPSEPCYATAMISFIQQQTYPAVICLMNRD